MVQTKFNESNFNFTYEGNIFDFNELKQKYIIGEKKYGEYFIDKLLKFVGGYELLQDIENEAQKEQERKTREFDKKNQHINSVIIKNFKLFNEINIKELDTINIIVGKNGSGKTSLLQAIAMGLLPQYATDWIPKDNDTRDYNNSLINRKKKDRFVSSEIVLKWTEFESEHRLDKDSFWSDKELPHTYLALGYGENLFTSPIIGSDIYIDALANGDSRSYSVASLFNNYNTYLPDPLIVLEGLLRGLSHKYSAEIVQEISEICTILQETLNSFLSLQPIEIFKILKTGSEFKFVDKQGIELSLYQISEGYRTNIVLLTDILIRIMSARKKLFLEPVEIKDVFKSVKGTILIDEFDKHLHPVWQRSFLSALERELPNIQFILTTHNVVALQSAEGHKALILNEKNEIEEVQIPVGYSIEALYKKFFDEKYFSENVSKQIDALVKWRDKMISENNFSEVDNKDFLQIIENLQVSSQTRMIANLEHNQLKKHKANAQTN